MPRLPNDCRSAFQLSLSWFEVFQSVSVSACQCLQLFCSRSLHLLRPWRLGRSEKVLKLTHSLLHFKATSQNFPELLREMLSLGIGLPALPALPCIALCLVLCLLTIHLAAMAICRLLPIHLLLAVRCVSRLLAVGRWLSIGWLLAIGRLLAGVGSASSACLLCLQCVLTVCTVRTRLAEALVDRWLTIRASNSLVRLSVHLAIPHKASVQS